MKDNKEFRQALDGKKVPLLILDSKWHSLFAMHGKTAEIKQLEKVLNGYLAEQGKCNSEIKDLKKLRKKLMESVVRNMDGASKEQADSLKARKLEENHRLISEINQKVEGYKKRLLELPHLMEQKNEELMLSSMHYCYKKMRTNKQEAAELGEWITQIRIELKENIVRKQDCELNNREIYAYMHDIFGPQVIDIFDMYEESETADSGDS